MINENNFGNYLRNLRESKEPRITQEQLGELLETKKNKMTISLIESGKNAPPEGEFLNNIIKALALTESEEIKLRDLSAIARGTVPSDILEYFNNNEGLRNAIRRAQNKGLTNNQWNKMIK